MPLLLYKQECDESLMDFEDFDFFKTAYSGVFAVLKIALNNLELYEFDINSADKYGNTLLHIVCQQGEENITKEILSLGANPNTLNKKKETPLTISCAEGHLKITELLISSGAKTNLKNNENENILFTAVRYNQLATLKYLQPLINPPKTVLFELNDLGENLLHLATKNDSLSAIKYLFKLGLHEAINDKSRLGETPVQIAVQNSNLEIVEFFVANSRVDLAKLDSKARTLLHVAILKQNPHVFNYLITFSDKIDINKQDFEGATPLHYAVDLNLPEFVTALLSKGAKIDVSDLDGYTPLHIASLNGGNFEILKLLVKSGADCGAETHEGDFPLHLAAATGNFKGAILLNSNLNGLNKSGFAPVDLAQENGHVEIAHVLLNRGGDNFVSTPQTRIPVKKISESVVKNRRVCKVPKVVRY